MKTYEKPSLIALSLSGNDMLCAGCTLTFREDLLDAQTKSMIDLGVLNYDQLFGSGDGCFATVEGYCKFTGGSNNTTVVFDS